MFLDDDEFVDDKKKGFTRELSPKREHMTAKYTGAGTSHEDDDEIFGSAGGLGSPSSSRARMLAQQREIQLKNRQKAMQNGGMIRSSLDEMRSSADSQFTPAIRQFSAPKTVKDGSSDAQEGEESSEFRIPHARKPVGQPPRPTARASRFSDDEDDEDYRRKRQENAPKARVVTQTSRDDDDDDDDDDNYGSRGRRNPPPQQHRNEDNHRAQPKGKGWTSAARGGDHDDEEEENNVPQRVASEPVVRGNQWQPTADESKTTVVTESSRSATAATNAPPAPLNLSNMRQFLTCPIPKENGIVQCYIRRNKTGTNRLFPVYSIYTREGDRFLMCSKKRPNNKTSNYLISMGEGDLSRDGANYLGKLRSNFVGTEFEIFDNGHNPNDGDDHMAGGHVRRDLGVVMYAPNVLGSRGPRKMQVGFPAISEEPSAKGERKPPGFDTSILARMKDKNHAGLAFLINKPPRWNEQVGAYVLNFNGRVTMASVKNFQLVDPDEHNSVVLQFGRVAKDEFTMDMQWPISPLQAFAITMSSFDSKIACD